MYSPKEAIDNLGSLEKVKEARKSVLNDAAAGRRLWWRINPEPWTVIGSQCPLCDVKCDENAFNDSSSPSARVIASRVAPLKVLFNQLPNACFGCYCRAGKAVMGNNTIRPVDRERKRKAGPATTESGLVATWWKYALLSQKLWGSSS